MKLYNMKPYKVWFGNEREADAPTYVAESAERAALDRVEDYEVRRSGDFRRTVFVRGDAGLVMFEVIGKPVVQYSAKRKKL